MAVIAGNTGVKTLSSEYISNPTHEAHKKGEGETQRGGRDFPIPFAKR